jgi:hypothetical protein
VSNLENIEEPRVKSIFYSWSIWLLFFWELVVTSPWWKGPADRRTNKHYQLQKMN